MKKIWIISLFTVFFKACSVKKSSGRIDQIPVIPNVIVVDYKSLIKAESSFIISNQIDSAFIMSSKKETAGYKINPYFNNISARAILENADPSTITAVKEWIAWYLHHINNDGSIYDYYIDSVNGKTILASTGDFDSIDSYAATFFTLLRKLCEVSAEDAKWLRGYSDSILKISKALENVIDKDGLTIAKPSYAVKYTMDNSEVQEGINDLVWLIQNVLNNGDAAYWQQLQAKNALAIENILWNTNEQNYFSSKDSKANWRIFYPDATCQLYPIWCKLIGPESSKAKNLWNTFNDYYPEWSSGKIYDAGGYTWTLISYVSALMNDKSRTDSYLDYVQSFTDKGLQPTENWYNLEAAFVILAAKKIGQ